MDGLLNTSGTRWLEGKLGFDFDNLFAYSTVKQVNIRDRKLGLIHALFRLSIIAYIIVYQLMYKCKHMVEGRVYGTTRMTLQRPTVEHCNPLHYDCEADLTHVKDLPYCKQADRQDRSSSSNSSFRSLDCLYLDEHAWNFGFEDQDSIFLATRYNNITQTKDHGHPKTNPYKFKKDDVQLDHYVADIERFTVLIDHSFISRDSGLEGKASGLMGFWETHDGKAVHSPCFYDTCKHQSKGAPDRGGFDSLVSITSGDIISFGDLLKMVGLNGTLDQKTDMVSTSLRDQGGILMIDVVYNNVKLWDFFGSQQRNITYTYRPRYVPTRGYKRMYIERSGDERVLHNFHGFNVDVVVQGNLVTFDPQHLLLVLTTSVTLLALSHFFVDNLATKVLPLRAKFKLLKFQQTEDFSDYRRRVAFFRKAECRILESNGGDGSGTQEMLRRSNFEAMALHAAVRRVQKNKPQAEELKFGYLPNEQELLAIILQHERRLNRLDARDEAFVHVGNTKGVSNDCFYNYLMEYRANFDLCIAKLAEAGDSGASASLDTVLNVGTPTTSPSGLLETQVIEEINDADMKKLLTEQAEQRRRKLLVEIEGCVQDIMSEEGPPVKDTAPQSSDGPESITSGLLADHQAGMIEFGT
mmetsp:Transcript_22653/g.51761  ORF Transcript_22653/g.51761 Transcript_22653/m.51761 type:complete len:638 (+) Transcript_22653:75-1988(+)